jgi:hypothetical protein
VWFPAPTVSLKPPPAVSAGAIAKFFYGCPENAFQVKTLFNFFASPFNIISSYV